MREIEQIKMAITAGKLPFVYLWYGEDRFLLKEALQVLKQAYLADDPSGSGIETVSGRETVPVEIVERANTISFFASRLVIVEEIPYFLDGQNHDLEPFYGYFLNPNPNTCLLFWADHIHKGKKFYKAIAQNGEILEFTSPKRAQDWVQWVQTEVQTRGKQMSRETVTFFLEWAGHQAGTLSRELDKLTIYVGDRGRIQEEDIRAVVTRTVEATVFELVDAVAGRSAPQALQKLHEVLREEHPLKVLTLIVRQIRLLLGANALRRQGGNVSEAGNILGIRSPYEAQKIWQQAQKLKEGDLEEALTACLQTEIALKTGGGDPVLLLEMLIIRFCVK